ncbi:MAG: DUF3795 domain-containing protein [Brevefilum sp.]|nr:DUF3795 domain-containing protein [Brevefilum sp.]
MSTSMEVACGLNDDTCEIRLAPFDQGAAATVLNWFKRQGWLDENEGMPEVLKRKMFCTGCLGNRETHWSTDCWILACCEDQHGLNKCSECPDFPCDRLVEWSEQDTSYEEALANLRKLNRATQ